MTHLVGLDLLDGGGVPDVVLVRLGVELPQTHIPEVNERVIRHGTHPKMEYTWRRLS